MDDLNALADEHLAAARANTHGRSAHLLLRQEPLRQTVIALTGGTALDEHNAPPAASLQVLRGTVRVTAGSGDVDLTSGGLHPLPRERHGLLALEDTVVLLTAVND
ncbi:cupin [Streptomyces sp. JH34]|uniref:cupin n=1 Tax=unclassified Streptomyces TaxID=2593676 RepID=UPI0023F78B60|nr:cupin [Streptomyces sp. JH34]MDF6022795.1 cupin [Streptomyces sp. JH34]